MNKAIISFIISALVGLGVGYVIYEVILGTPDNPAQTVAAEDSSTDTADTAATTGDKASAQPAADKAKNTDSQKAATVSANEDNILAKRGCLSCHSVGSLNLKGGQVGPDLSQAFTTVEGKHGKPIEEFLKQPTSAVMSGVISKNPLTDDERSQVLELLKKASEAK